MLGLGITGEIRWTSTHDAGISTDDLVLRHQYHLNPVQPLSDGAADINADAAANEYIDVGTIAIADGDVSISAWVYITTFVNEGAILSNRTTSGNRQGVELRCGTDSGNQFEMIIDEDPSGSVTSASTAKNTNQWYHVCGVWDRSGSQYLYVDGVLEDSDSITPCQDSIAHSQEARIGRNHGNTEMRGYVCNVGYWNRVLTPTDIKSIMWKKYSDLTSSETTSLVSWWNLDSTTTELATAVYDNHGGETFGSEILNQPILTGTNWINSNGTVSDGVGTVTIPSGGDYSYFIQTSMSYTEGAIYKATVTVKGTAGKAIRVRSETGSNNGGLTTSNGTITLTGSLQEEEFYFISNDQDDRFAIERHSADEAYSFEIHSASLKKLNGNTGTLS